MQIWINLGMLFCLLPVGHVVTNGVSRSTVSPRRLVPGCPDHSGFASAGVEHDRIAQPIGAAKERVAQLAATRQIKVECDVRRLALVGSTLMLQ